MPPSVDTPRSAIDTFKCFKDLVSAFRKAPVLTLISHPDSRRQVEPLVFRLPWLILAAFLLRYTYHPELTQQFSMTLLPPHLSMLAISTIYGLFLICAEFHRYVKQRTSSDDFPPRPWSRIYILIHSLFIASFFAMSGNPESDIPYLFIIPLVFGAQYLPVRNNLFALLTITVAFVSATLAVVFISSPDSSLSLLLRVATPKLFAFFLVGLYLLWTLAHLSCTEQMLGAVFEHSAVGITFIGQRKANAGDVPVDMQVLRMNAAQRANAPAAQANRGSCRSEFKSVAPDDTQPCKWCPTAPVLNGERDTFRSITISRMGNAAARAPVGYFDVSTSPAFNERRQIIAAVEIVTDVTAQVELAHVAQTLLVETLGPQAIGQNVEAFCRMFHLAESSYYEFDKEGVAITAHKQSQWDAKSAAATTGSWELKAISFELWNAIRNHPWSSESLEDYVVHGTGTSHEDAWRFWCIPSSSEQVNAFARPLGIRRGILARVDLNSDDRVGLLVGRFEDGPSDPAVQSRAELSYLDVINAQLAGSLLSATLRRISAQRDDSSKTQQLQAALTTATKNARGLYTVLADVARTRQRERIIGMCLHAITHGEGAAFSRALFLRLEHARRDSARLEFELAVGPREKAEACWTNPQPPLTDVCRDPHMLNALRESSATRAGRQCKAISLRDISQESALVKAIAMHSAIIGAPDDAFTRTAVAQVLEMSGPFGVAAVHLEDTVFGVIITDRKYLDDQRIAETELLRYIAAMCGCFLGNTFQAVCAVRAMRNLLEEIAPSAAERSRTMGDIARRVAEAAGLGYEETQSVRLAASVADVGLLRMRGDPLWMEKERLDDVGEAFKREHPRKARAVLKACNAPDESLAAAEFHHRIDGYPPGVDAQAVSTQARIVSLAEFYLALLEGRKYKDRAPMTAREAIDIIRAERNEEYGALIDALEQVV